MSDYFDPNDIERVRANAVNLSDHVVFSVTGDKDYFFLKIPSLASSSNLSVVSSQNLAFNYRDSKWLPFASGIGPTGDVAHAYHELIRVRDAIGTDDHGNKVYGPWKITSDRDFLNIDKHIAFSSVEDTETTNIIRSKYNDTFTSSDYESTLPKKTIVSGETNYGTPKNFISDTSEVTYTDLKEYYFVGYTAKSIEYGSFAVTSSSGKTINFPFDPSLSNNSNVLISLGDTDGLRDKTLGSNWLVLNKPEIFSDPNNKIDFNNLTDRQMFALLSGEDPNHATGGPFDIYLPNSTTKDVSLVGNGSDFYGSDKGDIIHLGDQYINVHGGAGNDTIYKDSKNLSVPTLYGGAGSDKFYIEGFATVGDFDKSDTVYVKHDSAKYNLMPLTGGYYFSEYNDPSSSKNGAFIKNFSGPLSVSDTGTYWKISSTDTSIKVSIADASVAPSKGGADKIEFVVSLDKPFSSGELTVRIPPQNIETPNSALNYSSANGFDVGHIDDPNSLSVTFQPGETSKSIFLPLDRSILIDPEKKFPIKAVINDSTDTGAVLAKDTAIGTIKSNVNGASLVNVSFSGSFDELTQGLIRADIEAAVQRISDAVGGHLPHLEIGVSGKTLAPGTAAQATPDFTLFHKGASLLEVPNALVEQLTGKDPNGSGVDLTFQLPSDVGERWYSVNGNGRVLVESTHFLTHEIIHGLGLDTQVDLSTGGVTIGPNIINTPWQLLSDGSFFYGSTAGKVALADDGHLATSNDLMNASPDEGRVPVSALDAAILSDLGYSSRSPQWAAGYSQVFGNGKLVDGYISGSTVYADANHDGILSAGESFTQTDAKGNFILPVIGYPLIATGGTDSSTGLPITAILKAPAGASVISPLTTLVADVGAANASKLLAALGLPTSIDVTTLDPIAIAQVGDATAYLASVKIYSTASLIGSVGSGTVNDGFAVLEQLLNSATSLVNLGDPSIIATLLTSRPGLDATTTTKLAAAIAGTISAIDTAAQGKTGDALITAASAVERVAEGVMTSALAAAGTSLTALAAAADSYTGQHLTDAITLAATQLPGSTSGSGGTGSGGAGSGGAGGSVGGGSGGSGSTGDLPTAGVGSGTSGDPGTGGSNLPSLTTLVHDATAPAGQAYALYHGLLGRAPDASGLQALSTALANGTSLHDAAQALLASPEGQSHLSAADNAGFVAQLYQSVLGRAPDTAGLANATAALDHGLSRADLADSLVFSPEHLGQLQSAFTAGISVPDPHAVSVAQAYYSLLGRAPDASGLQAFGNASLHDVAEGLMHSTEYASLTGMTSDTAYIAELYQHLLDRPADSAGAQTWTAALAGGANRAGVANALLDSAEFQGHYAGQSSAAYVEALYEHVLGRPGDTAGVQTWANALDHGASRTDVAHAFTASSEFQALAGGQSDAAFVEGLYTHALGRSADAAGEQAWLSALSHGASRADVVAGLMQSPEGQAHLTAQIAHDWHLT